MARRIAAVGCCAAAVLLTDAIVISRWPPAQTHLAEGYAQHPWLLVLDLGVPLAYLGAVTLSLWLLQRLTGPIGAPVAVVALSSWAFTCWFLFALSQPRVSAALRRPVWEHYLNRPKEEAMAYTARVATYLQGGFLLFASLGAACGLVVGKSRANE
jgi:hypothetical protein